MGDELRFDDLVQRLYEAAVSPELWKPALAGMSEWVGAEAFHMFSWDQREQRPRLALLSDDSLMERISLYDAYFHRIDPVRAKAMEVAPGQFFATQEHFDERYVAGSEYFQDFLLAHGVCWTTGGTLHTPGGVDTVLALVRARDRGRYSDTELARARRLWSHFHRATNLFIQTEALRAQAQLGARGLETVEMGIVATDRESRVLFSNAQAEAMLEGCGRIRIRDGRLGATDGVLDGALRAGITAAAGGRECTSLPVPAAAGRSENLLVTIAPLSESSHAWTVMARPSVVLLIRSRVRQRVLTGEQLVQLFRLTPAEARLARALAHGQSLEDYANEAGITMPTARTQLRSVFDKTGTRRQPELVKLLVSVPPVRT